MASIQISNEQREMLITGIKSRDFVPVTNKSEQQRLKRLANRGLVKRKFGDGVHYYKTSDKGKGLLDACSS